jgi:hypothetical protein
MEAKLEQTSLGKNNNQLLDEYNSQKKKNSIDTLKSNALQLFIEIKNTMLNVIPKQNRINSVCSNTIFSSGQ